MPNGVRIGSLATLIAIMLAMTIAAAASAAPVRFGAKLTADIQPQPAQWCDEPNDEPPHPTCTWIMQQAFGRAGGGVQAPKAGTIGRVRLKSCEPGRLRVQVARRVPGTKQYRVVRNGPVIDYQGAPERCGEDDDGVYPIESFKTSFTVRKGDRIAIRAARTGTLRCGSGGNHTWQFDPPLAAGGASRAPSDSEDCFLLMEWQYK